MFSTLFLFKCHIRASLSELRFRPLPRGEQVFYVYERFFAQGERFLDEQERFLRKGERVFYVHERLFAREERFADERERFTHEEERFFDERERVTHVEERFSTVMSGLRMRRSAFRRA